MGLAEAFPLSSRGWDYPRRGAASLPSSFPSPGSSQRLAGIPGASPRRCFPQLWGLGAVAWALLPSGGPREGSSSWSLPTQSIPWSWAEPKRDGGCCWRDWVLFTASRGTFGGTDTQRHGESQTNYREAERRHSQGRRESDLSTSLNNEAKNPAWASFSAVRLCSLWQQSTIPAGLQPLTHTRNTTPGSCQQCQMSPWPASAQGFSFCHPTPSGTAQNSTQPCNLM